MPHIQQKLTPCFWFDMQAEEAAHFYTSIFGNSQNNQISHYGKAGREVHGREPGSVMVVEFELEGQTLHGAQWRPAF